jgi:outer membrane lipoprotein-sorting protein
MTPDPIHDDLLAYTCDELDADRTAALKARLAADTDLAAEADALREAWARLIAEQTSDELSDGAVAELKARWIADNDDTEQWLAAAAQTRLSPDFTARLRARYVASLKPRRRWLSRSLIGMAACLLVGTGIWLTLLQPQPTHAYDISTASNRLQEVTSLHVRGTYYVYSQIDRHAPPDAQHWERYVARPYGKYVPTLGTHTGYKVSDGKTVVRVDHTTRQYIRYPEHPFAAKLSTEYSFRGSLVERLYGKPAYGYELVGTERHRDRIIEIYEQVHDSNGTRRRNLLWFDPSTGYVTRTKYYAKRADEPEHLVGEFDTVRYNVPPPPELFNFEPPQGYSATVLDDYPYDLVLASGAATKDGKTLKWINHCIFNINNRAVLLGWALVVEENGKIVDEPGLHSDPDDMFELQSYNDTPIWPHYHHLLRIDEGKFFHSRWSLIIPQDPHVDVSDSFPLLRFCLQDKHCVSGMGYPPLTLEPAKLREFVEEAQRATLPSGADEDQIFTLEELERIIDEYQSPEGMTDAGRDAVQIQMTRVNMAACLDPTY